MRNRSRIAALVLAGVLALVAAPAAGAPSGGDGRTAVNGTQLTGVHGSGDDGRIALNGTPLTGIRG